VGGERLLQGGRGRGRDQRNILLPEKNSPTKSVKPRRTSKKKGKKLTVRGVSLETQHFYLYCNQEKEEGGANVNKKGNEKEMFRRNVDCR